MSDYRLFPTIREGYRPDAPFATDADSIDGGGQAEVTLTVAGEGPDGPETAEVTTDISVYGPGEVTALDTDQIVRMEPEPGTSEFPPNYFPHVEFDNPRLPWQFSPEQADSQGRTRPWLCLVVVPRQQTTLGPPGTGPLSVLETSADQLPDPIESWAWAHAQLVGDANPEQAFQSRSSATVARLVCPRNLDPQTAYRACIVPTFEPGRRAGLGLDPYPEGRDTVGFAWTDGDVRLPVYHHWEFTSAKKGDFEYLARELEQRTFGDDVGFRTVDASNPGPESLKPASGADTDTGTVGVGGALRAIDADPNSYDETLQTELRDLLNNPHRVVEQTDYGAVGPPLYGQYHAGVPRLEDPGLDHEDFYFPHWFNTLNVDPRNRIAAGYGTQVVQHNQESLVQRAWEKFGEIQEANRKLNRAQLAEQIGKRRHQTLDSMSTGALLGMTAPIHGELFDEEAGATVYKQRRDTDLPSALATPAFRRITRPEGPLARREGATLDTSAFVTRLETGRVPRVTDGVGATSDIVPADGDGTSPAGEGAMEPLSADIGELGGTPGSGGGQPPATPDGEPSPMAFQSGDSAPPGEPSAADSPSHPGIERVHTVLDSIDSHAETAAGELTALRGALADGDSDQVAGLLDDSPTVRDRCGTVGPDTFGPLTRALSKLLADEPDALPPSFDRATANQRLQSLRRAQRDLDDAVDRTVQARRARQERAREPAESGPTDGTPAGESQTRGRRSGEVPREIRRPLDDADDALGALQQTAEMLRADLDDSPEMQAMTTETVSIEGAPETAPTSADTGSGQLGESASGQLAEPPSVGTAPPAQIEMPDMERLRETTLSGIDPATRIHDHVADVLGAPDLLERDDPVEEVMAYPTFSQFTYRLLAELNQEYFLPGAGEIQKNSMGVLQTNPEFIEAYMTGLNHEMARELRWRRYPTDRRGTYFRRFWDRRADPNVGTDDPDEMADIEPIHTWDENDLGENSPNDSDAQVVLLIKGELLRRYPNTDVFAAKASNDAGDRVPALPGTHVSRELAEGEIDHPEVDPAELTYPVFRGRLEPDITFFGFDITPDEALYAPYHLDSVSEEPDDHPDEGWFFVLQEPPTETRFGLDVGTEEDIGETPPGITTDNGTVTASESEIRSGVEHGLNAVSWAHLVEDGDPADVRHVSVADSVPGQEGWAVEENSTYVDSDSGVKSGHTYEDIDAAQWGYNSAHMARFTWQLPVRISVHADDMITEESASSWRAKQSASLRYLTPEGSQ